MKLNDPQTNKLSTAVRIMLGIASLPSLILAFMLVSMVIDGKNAEIDIFEVIYGAVGVVAFYIALSGKKLF